MKSYIGAGTQLTDTHHDGVGRELVQIDDGRWHHRFGASWVKTADLCPERARLEHEEKYVDIESDAAQVGTCVHTAIETCLHEQNEGEALDEATTVEIFHDAFTEAVADPRFAFIKWKTEKGPRAFGEHCVQLWHRKVLPTLPLTAKLETRFVLPFYEDDTRVIELSGAIDYCGGGLKDWKTNGRDPYEEWEYKRWAIQPTFYTWAANELGLILPTDDGYIPSIDGIPFEFVVLSRRGVQRFTVMRDMTHWAWLSDKLLAFAELIESGLDVWPKQDNHALCSPKWCPSWDECKGKHIAGF